MFSHEPKEKMIQVALIIGVLILIGWYLISTGKEDNKKEMVEKYYFCLDNTRAVDRPRCEQIKPYWLD